MQVGASPCMFCHDKNGFDGRVNVLENMRIAFRDVVPADHSIRFDWGRDVHSRCRYGLHCADLVRKDRAVITKGEALNSVLTTIVQLGDDYLVRELFTFLQGNFPFVYNQVVREMEKVRSV